MDEKRLAEVEEGFLNEGELEANGREIGKILELARLGLVLEQAMKNLGYEQLSVQHYLSLGLWATQHAVPALEFYAKGFGNSDSDCGRIDEHTYIIIGYTARKAIKEMPRDREEG